MTGEAVSSRKGLNAAGRADPELSQDFKPCRRASAARLTQVGMRRPAMMRAGRACQTPAAGVGWTHMAWYRMAWPLAGSVAITLSLACSQVVLSGNDMMGK